jgi:site-specific DNA recombinase
MTCMGVCYLRVSSEPQNDDANFDRQRTEVWKLAAELGVEIVEVFQEVKSGYKDSASRPEFKNMQRYLHENKKRIDFVLFYDVKRLCRSVAVGANFIEELRELDIDVRVAKIPSATVRNGEGRRVLQIAMTEAEFGGAVRQETAIEAWSHAAHKGRLIGHAPWGYKNVGGKGVNVVIDEDAGPLMQLGFQLVADRIPTIEAYRVVKLRCKEAGIKPASLKQFRKNLANPFYAGWIRNKHLSELKRSIYEPLISDSLFAEVQAVLEGRRKSHGPRPGNPEYPFNVRCTCGTKLTGSTSKGKYQYYGYYACKKCGARHPKAKIEKIIEELITGPFEREYMKECWLEQAAQFYSAHVANVEQQERSQREKRRLLEEAKREARTRSLTAGNPELREEYEEAILSYRKQIEEIDLGMARLTSERNQQEQWLQFAETLFTADVPKLYEYLTPSERERVRTLLFSGDVLVDPESQSPNFVIPCLYGVLTELTSESETWRARRDSNSRPTAPEAAALSS